jgi:hypothetical protein
MQKSRRTRRLSYARRRGRGVGCRLSICSGRACRDHNSPVHSSVHRPPRGLGLAVGREIHQAMQQPILEARHRAKQRPVRLPERLLVRLLEQPAVQHRIQRNVQAEFEVEIQARTQVPTQVTTQVRIRPDVLREILRETRRETGRRVGLGTRSGIAEPIPVVSPPLGICGICAICGWFSPGRTPKPEAGPKSGFLYWLLLLEAVGDVGDADVVADDVFGDAERGGGAAVIGAGDVPRNRSRGDGRDAGEDRG